MRRVEEFPLIAEPLRRAADEWTRLHPGATDYIDKLLRKGKKSVMFCSQAAWLADHMFGVGDLEPDDVDLLVAPEHFIDATADLGKAKTERFRSYSSKSYCRQPKCSKPCDTAGCGDAMRFEVAVTHGMAGDDKIEFMRPLGDIYASYKNEEKPTLYSWYPTDTVFDNSILIETTAGKHIAISIVDSIIMYGIRQSIKKSDQRKAYSLHCLGQLLGDYYTDFLYKRYSEIGIGERVEEFIKMVGVVGTSRWVSHISNYHRFAVKKPMDDVGDYFKQPWPSYLCAAPLDCVR